MHGSQPTSPSPSPSSNHPNSSSSPVSTITITPPTKPLILPKPLIDNSSLPNKKKMKMKMR